MQRCLTTRRSSKRLGAVSGELDGRERGRGSPAASAVRAEREREHSCAKCGGGKCGALAGL
jgi:hypothetical protein